MVWDWWDVQTKGQYAATLLALFLAVVIYRYLVRVELILARRTAAGGAGGVVVGGGGGGGLVNSAELGEPLVGGGIGGIGGIGVRAMGGAKVLLSRLPWPQRLAHAVLGGALYAYALLLMLAAMTYNACIFLALVLGYIAGEFLFGTSLAAGGLAAVQAKGSACCD